MLNKFPLRILCRLGSHDWRIETRGQTHQGSVYPIRFRTCKHCPVIEQEIYDASTQTSSWIQVKVEVNLSD